MTPSLNVISCDKGQHLCPIPKVRPHGLYYVYYPAGIFFCDRTNLTPSDKKLGRGANKVFTLVQCTQCK